MFTFLLKYFGLSQYKQLPRWLYTWTAPNGRNCNQINFFMIIKSWSSSFWLVKTWAGTACGNDHWLLSVALKLKLKANNMKQEKLVQ